MPARAQGEDRGPWGEAGIGVLATVSTFFYGPVKVVYAGLGAVTAGFVYALSGGEQSSLLLARSLRGDYVITPGHLTGQRQLVFVGRDPQAEPSPYSEPYAY